MLTPYVYTAWDQGYKDAVAESLVEEGFIATQIATIALAIAEYGATPTPQEMAALDSSLNALADNYVRLREIQLRMKVIASEASASQQSILGYSPDEISRQSDLRAAAYNNITLDLRSAITSTSSQQELLLRSSSVAAAISVLGEAVGPIYDAAMTWKSFSEGDDYAGIANSISGVVGVLAGAVIVSTMTASSLPVTISVGVLSGTLTTMLGAVVERTLVRFDVLDIDELTPDVNNIEALKRLTDIRELIDTLDIETPSLIALSMLDSAAGTPGEHIDAFFEKVKKYFDGGEQFETVEDLVLALRQSNFENNRQGFLLVDLSNLSTEQLYSRAIEDSDIGQSVRYALINTMPFATGIIEGTAANQSDYDLENYSENYLRDRALFLRGYLDGMQDETISQLNIDGGLRVYTDFQLHDRFYIEDVDKTVVVTNFSYSQNATYITFGTNNDDLIDGAEGSNVDRLYGDKGNDTLNGFGGKDYLEGGIGNDVLNGGDGDDQLIGGHGDDVLEGGEGKDKLEGGIGNDTYIFNGAFGFDEIKDQDGIGSIVINNQTVGEIKLVDGADIIYRDADEQFEALLINEGTSTSLLITALDETGGRIMIKDWQDGELGIVLSEGEIPAPGNVGTVIGDAGNNAITLDNLRDNKPGLDLTTFTALHADGGAGNDILMGRLHGNDTLFGGEGDDIISGGFTRILGENAASQLQPMTSTPGQDHIDGGAGKDVIFASLGGGVAHGGADDDILLATGPAYFQFNNLEALEPDSEAGIPGHGAINRDQVLADVFPFLEFGIEQNGDNYSLITRYFNDFTDDYQAYASQIEGLNFIGRLGAIDSDHSAGNVGYSFPERYTFTYDYSTADGLTPEASSSSSNPRAVTMAISIFEPGEGHTYENFANVKGANLLGDGGNDFLAGGMYADYLSGGADQDTLFGGEGNDVLDGGSEDDVLFGGGGIDILVGGAGNDTLSGDEQDDVLFGGDGDDQLHGGDGNDYLDGGRGKSYLYGGAGADTLTAGPGYFYMDGGEGDDTYLVQGGISNDPDTGAVSVINDNKGNNTLAIMGITDFSTLNVTVSGNHLFIDTGDGRFSIANGLTTGMMNIAVDDAANTLVNGNTPSSSSSLTTINRLLLAQLGTAVTRTAQVAGEELTGGLKNDTLYAHAGGSILIGGVGNDSLRGGVGDDTYLLRLGDGRDTITEAGGGNNVIQLGEGLTPDQIRLARSGSYLVLAISSGEYISVNGMFDDATGALIANRSIHALQFADGTEWDINRILAETVRGTSASEMLYGSLRDEELRGDLGNDYLYGYGGDDIYEYNSGDGNDVIIDSAGTDVIRFGNAVSETDVRVQHANSALMLFPSSGEQIMISRMFTSGGAIDTGAIESVQFADGTVWDMDRIKQEALWATAGDDTLEGFDTNDEIRGLNGNDQLNGHDGDDSLIGGGGKDNLRGGAGNDLYIFESGGGEDYVYESSGVDELFFDGYLSPSDLSLRRKDASLVIQYGDTDKVTISGMFDQYTGALKSDEAVETIRFSNGDSWGIHQIKLNALWYTDGNDQIYGFDSDDYIVGGKGNDSLHGANGDDYLIGESGDDSLVGSAGNDTLSGGGGRDILKGGTGDDVYAFSITDFSDSGDIKTISDNAGINIIRFEQSISESEIINVSAYMDSYLCFDIGKGQIRIENAFNSSGSVNQSSIPVIEFSNGVIWDLDKIKELNLMGTSLNDVIYGYETADILFGKEGNDTLRGRDGDDIYIFGRGHGKDHILETQGMDIVRYADGISENDLVVRRSERNLILNLTESDKITIGNMFSASTYEIDQSKAIEKIEFDNGVSWSLEEIKAAALMGTGRSDYIQAFSTNDVIKGGKGNDTLEGYNGDDIYEFYRNDGRDIIRDSGGRDTIRFLDGISPDDVMVHQDEGDTYFIFREGSQIKVEGRLTFGVQDQNYLIEYVEFSNGVVWDSLDVEERATETNNLSFTLLGTSSWDELHVLELPGDFYLNGINGNDHVTGGRGNDTLVTGGGFNFFKGGAGNDTFLAVERSETIILDFTYGSDRILYGEGVRPEDVRVRIELPTLWRDVRDGVIYYRNGYPSERDHSLVLYSSVGSIELRDIFKSTLSPELASDSIASTVEFQDGTVWTIDDLMAFALVSTEDLDRIRGTAASEILTGGGGRDTLEGFGGDDTIIGGADDDYLDGGYGNDSYHFDAASGNDVIYDISGTNQIVFDSSVSPYQISVARETVNLILEWNNNSIRVVDAFYETDSGFELISLIKTVSFSDGTMWGHQELLHFIVGEAIPGYDEVPNTPVIYVEGLKGTYYGYHQPDNNNVNLLNLSQVREVINNNEPDAEFIGQSIHYTFARTLLGSGTVLQTFLGNDANSLTADPGDTSDAILHFTGKVALEAGEYNFRVRADDGYSIVIDGNVVAEYNGKQGSTLRTHDAFRISETGKHDIEIIYWDEGSSHDFRVEVSDDGGASYQRLEGAMLSHEVDSSVGDSIYDFDRGNGAVAVSEQGGTDQLNLGSTIATDQLWFERSGDDLLLSIIGTTDAIVVNDWYVDPVHQVETFAASDGALLHSADVDNLVQAMAAFAPPAMGETSLSQTYRDALEPVIAANWQ